MAWYADPDNHQEEDVEGAGTPFLFVKTQVRDWPIGGFVKHRDTGMIYKVRRYNEERGGWELSWAD